MSATETISPDHAGLDAWPAEDIFDTFVEGQRRAIAAVERARPALIDAAAALADRVRDDGRIVYAGAGSSGMIAALDGMELGGTFGWPDERVAFVLAEGDRLRPFSGGFEDDAGRARSVIAALHIGPADAMIAVAASGATPFTVAAVEAARARGALTIGIAANPDSPLLRASDIPVLIESGPEVIAGSTRMGAGTAQKAALNIISSLVMIRLGRVYDGLMVDLRADNAKLLRRAVATLRHIAGAGESEAEAALARAGGSVKRAALMLRGLTPEDAERLLDEAGGNLRMAFARLD
jgi:N-acetylmuramic acid 6-phosphate etherase